MAGEDFLAECEALDTLVGRLSPADFAADTGFYGWSVRDQILHLLFLDDLTLTAIEREADFLAELAAIRDWQRSGELSDYVRRRYAAWGDTAVVAAWRETYRRLAETFRTRDPKQRMRWFGPDMSLVSAASARQMEVWAHGQDIHDLFGVARDDADRIRNICELGVRTYGWTFGNRGLDVPGPPPRVALTAPSGALWTWNADETSAGIEGPAPDFAAVVTQRRHVDDTALIVCGDAARSWMEKAQCFAGAPSDGPPAKRKGERDAV